MWPLAGCISSVLVRTPSLQLGVLQFLQVSFHLSPILPFYLALLVKKQPSEDVLHGNAAEEELGLAHLVSSYTLPHQNSQPGRRGQQTAHSKVLSRCARDT